MSQPTRDPLYQGLPQHDTGRPCAPAIPWLPRVLLALATLLAGPSLAGPGGTAGCDSPLEPGRFAFAPWSSVRAKGGGADAWADPSSFDIGSDGSVTVLSPGLARLSLFRNGQRLAVTALPADSSFEDLLSLDGETLLLSRTGVRRGVFRLLQDGSVRPVVGWPDEDIPDAGSVTALEGWEDGWWAVVGDEYAVQLSGPATGPAATMAGTARAPGGALRAVLGDGEVAIHVSPRSGGASRELVRWPLSPGLHALHLAAQLDDGRILVLLSAEAEQRFPDVAPDVTGLLLTGAAGQTQPCATVVPWDTRGAPPFEPLRRARLVQGGVYYWRATRRGVETRFLQP